MQAGKAVGLGLPPKEIQRVPGFGNADLVADIIEHKDRGPEDPTVIGPRKNVDDADRNPLTVRTVHAPFPNHGLAKGDADVEDIVFGLWLAHMGWNFILRRFLVLKKPFCRHCSKNFRASSGSQRFIRLLRSL